MKQEPFADLALDFETERACAWTNVFKRDSGWFGGDGIFTIPYYSNNAKNKDSILFVFSDTMVGEIVKDDSLLPGSKMVNNSYAVLQNKNRSDSIKFHIASENGKKTAAFTPQETSQKEHYWLGDGVVHDKDLYLFAYQIINLDHGGDFAFEQVHNDLLKIDKDLNVKKQFNIPFFNKANDSLNITFGAGVYKDSTTLYIYGVRETEDAYKELIVAKTTMDEISNFNTWKFKIDQGWTEDYKKAQAQVSGVANELSVSKLDNGHYALVYQEGGIFSKIYLRLSKYPYGPFGKKQLVWDTKKDLKDSDLYTYNAKAHPALSKPNELLITYNVNSFKFFEMLSENPHLYRPRFIKIRYE